MPGATKVLHVYSGNLFGGVERMLISLASMADSECRHLFALCFDAMLARELRAQGASVAFLPAARIRNPLSLLRAREALKELLRAERFDAVICHSIWSYCIFAPIVSRAGYPTILYLHDMPDARGWYYRWAARSPPRVCMANSAFTGTLIGRIFPTVRVKIVHPLVNPPQALDSASTQVLRAQLGAKPGELVVLLASRFDSMKGHRNLLRALHAVREISAWRCWIAGAPQRPHEEAYKRELLELASSLGIAERVAFIGHRDDMAAVLAASDIYCQPNETPEAFGMVFVEAMYAAKPVVTSPLGGALEIVGPECGILCTPGAALAAALRRLLEDTQLRERMAHAGPLRAAELCGGDLFKVRFREALEAAAPP